jgi:hypothetical protein
MISKPVNIARVKARATLYWGQDEDAYTKVCHQTLASYDDDDIEQALLYVDRMGGVDVELEGDDDVLMDPVEDVAPRREEPKKTAEPAKKKEEKVAQPFDSTVTIGETDVVVKDRALKHIPPPLWPGFANWIVKSSLGTRIAEAGESVKDWFEVTLTSDEVLDQARANYRMRIVCSWKDGTLNIYHAHPDLKTYPSYF